MKPKTKVRIILSGGGIKGTYQLGVLSEIVKSEKYEIDKIYGCSIGAILAPMVVNNKIEEAINVLKNIRSIDDIVNRYTYMGYKIPDWYIIKGFNTLFNMGAYKSIKLVDKVFDSLTKQEIINAGKKCHVVAFDIMKNREVWFSGEEIEFGVKCSSALWMAVPPIERNGTLYTDGGVTEIFPLQYIIDNETEEDYDGEYIFIDCDSRKYFHNSKPTNGIELMSTLHWSSSTNLSELELKNAFKYIPKLQLIRPERNILLHGFDTDKSRIDDTFDMGVQDGKEFLRTKIE